MNDTDQYSCGHDHIFLGADQAAHERRTWLVIVLTAVMMVIEITAGIVYGSMALLADGWHMASHASALSITAVAYLMARRHAADPRFSFGTGKVGDLAAFTSALLLGGIAVIMAYESVNRLISPVAISFDEAIAVAVIGLVVNLVSAFILKERPHDHDGHGDHHHDDHNIRAAYLHVVADALTSLTAIAALITGRFLGWVWMDPLMGIVGAIVISRWSYGLLRDSGRILLDMQPGNGLMRRVREALEEGAGVEINDLHVWRIGPGHYAVIVSMTAADPQSPSYYKDRLCHLDEISHVSVEVNPG